MELAPAPILVEAVDPLEQLNQFFRGSPSESYNNSITYAHFLQGKSEMWLGIIQDNTTLKLVKYGTTDNGGKRAV